jgi:hypothetical protein
MPKQARRAVEQRDAADEGRLELCGSIVVGSSRRERGLGHAPLAADRECSVDGERAGFMTGPRSLMAVAIAAVLVGGVATVIGGRILPEVMSADSVPVFEPGEPGNRQLGLLFQHFRALALLQFGAAALATVAGVALLDRRRWAAYTIESLAWLNILSLIGVAGLFEWLVIEHRSHAVETAQRQVMWLLIGMPVLLVLFWGCFPALVIWVLRRPRNRAALR